MSIPILFPRQNGKSMVDLWKVLNGALQNKVNNTIPTTDTLYKEQKSTFALDSLYDENENTFYQDRLYDQESVDLTKSYEMNGCSVREMMDKWIRGISDVFARF